MSVVGLWRHATRLGVTAEVEPEEIRCIVFVNVIAVFGAFACVMPFFLVGSASPAALVINLSCLASLFLILGLNRAGFHTAARLLLCVGTLAAGLGQAINLGPEDLVHYYLLPIALVPFFAFPARQSSYVYVLGCAAAGSFLAVTFGEHGEVTPLVEAAYVYDMLIIAAITPIMGYYARVLARTAEKEIERERRAGDDLLGHALPRRFVAMLREGVTPPVEVYEEVSVLHADIAGFTPLAESISPEALVRLLNEITLAFDALCVRHGAEKVKTVGDAYIAVAGVPERCADHARRLAALGSEMLATVRQIRERRGHAIDLRIGLASGPAVAGVVGRQRFAYEVWGEAVVVAARLEAMGAPGEIHVSMTARAQLGDGLVCDPLGEIEVRGQGFVSRFVLRAAGLGRT